MRVEQVDPRDIRWEIDTPAYRVYFWTRLPAADDAFAGWECDEFELREADLQEVIAWAEQRVDPGGRYVLYAVVDNDRHGLGLLRLAGIDPTSQSRVGH